MTTLISWLLRLLIVLCGIATILRYTLLTPWTIPDDARLNASIAPTLSAGDLLLVLTRGTPHFGDLVRCRDPDDASKYVVGRIAGEAGDVVQVERDALVVNGRKYTGETPCPNRRLSITHPSSGEKIELACDIVKMAGGWYYRGFRPNVSNDSELLAEKKEPAEIRSGHIYLVSDNRFLHDDSRDFGPMKASDCMDRIVVRLWSRVGWDDEAHRLDPIH